MALLSELVERFGGDREGGPGADPEVLDVHVDSRRLAAGGLFAALPGRAVDGARFAADARARGAVAVLSPRSLPELGEDLARWVHPDARRVAGLAAAHVYGDPSRACRTVGITGTNGKSTVAHLVGELLTSLGGRPAVVGTVGYRLWASEPLEATHTTPDATELQRLCRRNLELGGDAFVLEVSSHALDQERMAGMELDVAVFTNLSPEHLDYHHDMATYAAAKERIFACLKAGGDRPAAAVVHADDAYADRMVRAAKARGARVVTYGTGSRADLRVSEPKVGDQGIHLFLEGMGIPRTGFYLPLIGRHNALNALAALAVVLLLGASPENALQGLASISSPPGRLEPVATGDRGFRVFVDYAHTPDALERVLESLRELVARAGRGRVVCVFGCGGDRDREKRRPMGAIAGRLADAVVVTSDNPRGEDPEAIADEVARGLEGTEAESWIELDRRAAIARALDIARPGDVVLVAGKGHETWQQRRESRVPFDDRRVILEELR